MTAPRVLVVEDDPSLSTVMLEALHQSGMRARPAATAAAMWQALDDEAFDLVVLDVMLPGAHGLDLCRQIRQQSDIPIIFVSARASETDRVIGLELGADDYIAKPFDLRELEARIRAVLRRGRMEGAAEGTTLRAAQFDGWTVNFLRREILSPAGDAVELTGAEFNLLATLIENAQRVIARERLIELSRPSTGDSSDRSIDVLISRLRRKISHEGRDAPIMTVRGVGYMFSAEVRLA